MDIDELQSVRDRERQTDKPQQLRESFYADVGAFVEQLRTERDRAAERHDSPYADEVMRLTDEIDAARQLVEDIHERRIGKVVKAASLEAAELSPEVTGLTAEEWDLFEQLVSDIEHHRQDVLSALKGDDPGSTAGDPGEAETGSEPAGGSSEATAADLMGGEGATPDGGGQTEPNTDTSTDTPDGSTEQGGQHSPDPTATDRRPPTEADGGNETDGTGSAPDDHHGRTGSQPEAPAGADAASGSTPTGGGEPGQEQVTATDRNAATENQTGQLGGQSAAAGRSTSARGEQATSEVGGQVERERVLVTENVATFVGSDDRDYDLVPQDVVTLPSTNAEILVERDAARRL